MNNNFIDFIIHITNYIDQFQYYIDEANNYNSYKDIFNDIYDTIYNYFITNYYNNDNMQQYMFAAFFPTAIIKSDNNPISFRYFSRNPGNISIMVPRNTINNNQNDNNNNTNQNENQNENIIHNNNNQDNSNSFGFNENQIIHQQPIITQPNYQSQSPSIIP